LISNELRQSLTIFVVDSDLNRGHELVNLISQFGYTCEHRVDEKSLRDNIIKNPPHIIFLQYDDAIFLNKEGQAEKYIADLKATLPETHIFILASSVLVSQACELFHTAIDDVFTWPITFPLQLSRALDRTAMNDFYFYKSEQIDMAPKNENSATNDTHLAFLEIFQKSLKKKMGREEQLDLTLSELARYYNTDLSLYFRYNPGAGTIVVMRSYGLPIENFQGVGINIRKNEPGFTEDKLLQPSKIRVLREFIISGMNRLDFVSFPHIENKILRGIFVVPAKKNQVYPDIYDDSAYAQILLNILKDRVEFLDLESKYNRLSVFDEESQSFRRDYILQKLKEEVSRARRITKPISLLLINIDKYAELVLDQTENNVEQFLLHVGTILGKSSRLNDLVGRYDKNQFILLLPHTNKKGAMIKAERIRRTFEIADFSKVLAGRKNITLSIGVSEYPSICHDANGILATAEISLNEILKYANNRANLAVAPFNFIPDFIIENE
jgi:diguanylate cyclase (GGDEF)-like protein